MLSINPFTEQQLAAYPEASAADVERSLGQASDAFRAWRGASLAERGARMAAAGAALRQRRDALAALITAEMGKPLSQAAAEVDKCAWVCEFYAQRAEQFLAPECVPTEAAASYVRYDPLGPVLAVMPWNFPLWQAFRFAAPTLMAGNVGLLKHASNVQGCALAIQEVFSAAGFPAGAFTTLVVGSAQVEALIADPRIAAVTLTGSEQAGRNVAAAAGRHLKKCVLELGGSDAFLVLADADVAAAAEQAARARTLNSGQSCIAAKRFVVESPIYDEFVAALTAAMQRLPLGDPNLPTTAIGPLARRDLVDDLHRQVAASVAAGAQLRCGGRPAPGTGYFYPATVLADVQPGAPAADEELFGPVAAVLRAADADHAVQLANDSRFGLGASVWTRDLERAQHLAAQLEAGAVFVNEIVKSDPRLPFGGVKASGYGRELGAHGIREFANVKTVWIA